MTLSGLKNIDKELNVRRQKFGQYLGIGQDDFTLEAYEPNNEIKISVR